MASKRRKKRVSCIGKYRYTDNDSAKLAARALQADKGLMQVHAYHCPYCKQWHIGRQKTRRK